MDQSEVVEAIAEFLSSHCGIDRAVLDPDAPLFTTGKVSSYDLVLVLTFLAERYRVDIDTEALDIDHLDTLNRIAAIVVAHES